MYQSVYEWTRRYMMKYRPCTEVKWTEACPKIGQKTQCQPCQIAAMSAKKPMNERLKETTEHYYI